MIKNNSINETSTEKLAAALEKIAYEGLDISITHRFNEPVRMEHTSEGDHSIRESLEELVRCIFYDHEAIKLNVKGDMKVYEDEGY